MKRRLWQNIVVIVISFGGATLFGYLLYSDLYLNKRTFGAHTPAGMLREKTQTVRRKFSDNMVFDSLTAKDTLYWNDSIQTEEHSAATIVLDAGNRINLGASSLVVLEKDNDGLSLNLKSGRIVIDSANGTTAAAVKVNGTEISKQSGEQVAVQMDSAKGQLTAVTKSPDGTAKEITVDRQGHLEEKIIPAALLTPPPLHREYSEATKAKVDFTWSTKSKDGAEFEETLQVARNGDFTEAVTQRNSANHQAAVELGLGTYFWRVKLRDKDKKDVYSESRTFDLLAKAAPALKSPKIAEVIAYKTELPSVEFNWASKASATKYIFEIARDDGFKDIIFKDETSNTSYRTSKLIDGTLYWRVTSIFGDDSMATTAHFSVFHARDIVAPALTSPEKNFAVTLDYFEKNGGVSFKWKPVPDETYHFILARKSDLKEPLIEIDTAQAETIFKEPVTPGTYYWASGVKDQQGQWKYDEARAIIFGPLTPVLAAPLALGPAENSDLDLLGNPKITWTWAAVEGAKEYHFKLLKVEDRGAKVIFEDSLKGVAKEKSDLPDGSYKWIVSSVDDFGRESPPAAHGFTVRHGKTLEAPSFDMSEVQ